MTDRGGVGGRSCLPGHVEGIWGYTVPPPCEEEGGGGRDSTPQPPPPGASGAAHPRAVPAPGRLARRTDRPWGTGGRGRAGAGVLCVTERTDGYTCLNTDENKKENLFLVEEIFLAKVF